MRKTFIVSIDDNDYFDNDQPYSVGHTLQPNYRNLYDVIENSFGDWEISVIPL